MLHHRSVEIVVKVLNVGYNEEKEILKKSRTLYEYSRFVQIVRETLSGRKDKENAVKEAVLKALAEGILTDFLNIYGSEVADMAYREFNYEEYIEQVKKDFYEEGEKAGKEAGRREGLEDAMCTVAAKLKAEGTAMEKIMQITGLEREIIEKL